MKIAIGSDHAGYDLKQIVVDYLQERGLGFKDYGTYDRESCDYPDIALEVSKAVRDGDFDRGILMCGTGVGMSMQANKVEGVRASLNQDVFTAELSRLHNDANVLCIGGRVVGPDLAKAIVEVWLDTEFSGEERHQRRVDKIGKD